MVVKMRYVLHDLRRREWVAQGKTPRGGVFIKRRPQSKEKRRKAIFGARFDCAKGPGNEKSPPQPKKIP